MAKQGKGFTIVAVLALVVLVAIAVGVFTMRETAVPTGGVPTPSGVATCPSDLGFSGTVTVQNLLNVSSAETYDNTMYFYEVQDDGTVLYKTSISDTTAGSVTLTCGKTYIGKILSTDGASGDNSIVQSATMSGGKVVNIDDGYVKFTVLSDSGELKLYTHQRGNPQVRVKDIETDAFMYENSGAIASLYNATDAANFSSSVNQTAYAVGTGGSHNVRIEMQTQSDDLAFNDRDTLFLIDESASVWDVPVVKLDGSTLTNVKSSLNTDEARAFADYEYVYLIPKEKTFLKPDKIVLEVYSTALGGQNPGVTDDPIFQWAPRGTYTSVTDSNLLKVGAVKDDSSLTAVYTMWTMNFGVS